MVSKDHPNPCTVTGIHGFKSSLHYGSVYAGHEPCSHHHASQYSQYAGADSHHHIVEEEEVVEAVERLPVVESQRFLLICGRHFVLKEEDLNHSYLENHQADHQSDGQKYCSQVAEHDHQFSMRYRKNQHIGQQYSKEEVDKMDYQVA